MIHVQYDSTKDMHRLFQKSEEYDHFQATRQKRTKVDGIVIYKPRTIGCTVFRRAICDCCRKAIQRDCANYKIVALYLLLTALAKLRTSLKDLISVCTCKHHTNQRYNDMHKSVRSFKDYVLCKEVEYKILQRTPKSDKSRAELEQIEIDIKTAAFKEKQSKADFRMPDAARPSKVIQKKASHEGRIGILLSYDYF